MNGMRVVAATAAVAGIVFACAPDPGPFFDAPEFPENQAAFDSGRLGLITPALKDDDELKAYRLLSGLPVPDDTQAADTALKASNDEMSGWRAWDSVHKAAIGPTPSIFQYRNSKRGDAHIWYDNCLDNAFTTAAVTYAARKTSYSSRADLVNWVKAQDQVFSNCDGAKTDIPDPVAADNPALVRKDREYQIAAAHFYAEDLDEAGKDFAAIAADKQSPWAQIAAYMVCRTELRRSSLYGGPDEVAAARDHFLKIAIDPAFGSLAASAKGIAEHIAALENPKAEFARVSAIILAPNANATDFAKALHDASYLLTSEKFSSTASQPDIAGPFRWVYLLGREQKDPATAAWASWQSDHALPSLTLASALASANDSFVDELIQDSDRVNAQSPAYGTISYNLIRLLIEQQKDAEARQRLSNIQTDQHQLPPSLSDAYAAERMRVATDFQDMLRWAPRVPIALQGMDSDLPTLAYDSAFVLNYRAPLNRMAEAAKSSHLPRWNAADLAIATWTRAFILGNDEVVRDMAALISKDHPAWAESLAPSADREEWRFRAALLISLRDSFQPVVAVNYAPQLQKSGDWWCVVSPVPPPYFINASYGPYSQVAWKLPTVFHVPDRILSTSEQDQAQKELGRANATGPAQQFLATIVLPYAKAHPDDPKVPLALHRLVMVVRYGCDRENPHNVEISKTAFNLLHNRYPNSEWTKKTPYWFK